MALGADRQAIMRMILGQILRALALSRAAASLLFGVAWKDGLTFASATSLLLAAALAAAHIPARWTTRVDPVVALSSE